MAHSAIATGAVNPKAQQSAGLLLTGAPAQSLEICGRTRSALFAAAGTRVSASVRLADRRNLRAGGRRARLTVDRCESGRWRRVRSRRFGRRGPYRRVSEYVFSLDTGTVGDYRAQVRVGGDRRREPARSGFTYLRVTSPGQPTHTPGEIADIPLRFAVTNTNRSRLTCPTDGRPYAIVGHLTAPRAALEVQRPAVTLWVHGGESSGAYLRLPVHGYDMAYELARLGHASVVVDRLGHGRSDAPPGGASCIGGQADITHQIVAALRTGSYTAAAPGRPTAFARVALASHSFGGLIAEYEAGSFDDVDALLVSDSSFSNPSIGFLSAVQQGESPNCPAGGQTKRGGGPPAYAFVWPNDQRYNADVLYDAGPTVTAALAGLRERNPCGDLQSTPQAIIGEPDVTARVHVPVLLVFGDRDAIFPPPAGERQRQLFSGSRDVALVTIKDAGHTAMLERQAPAFRAAVSHWLGARGL